MIHTLGGLLKGIRKGAANRSITEQPLKSLFFFFFGFMEWFQNKIFSIKRKLFSENGNWQFTHWSLEETQMSTFPLGMDSDVQGGRECWQDKNNHLLLNRRGSSQVGHTPHRGNSSTSRFLWERGEEESWQQGGWAKEIWAVFLAVSHVEKAGLNWRDCKTGRSTIKAYVFKAHLNF